jgi:uncharacterized OB-fold protein
MMMVQQRPPRTLGPGHDTFWEWCGKDELRLPRCTACGEMAWPVAPACRHCGAADFAWEALSGEATLVSWCGFVQDYYGGMMPVPFETIVVELAGGPLFLSNPHGFVAADAPFGARLRVAFIDCEDRTGRFRLPVFERV